jgi:hypothetical protein
MPFRPRTDTLGFLDAETATDAVSRRRSKKSQSRKVRAMSENTATAQRTEGTGPDAAHLGVWLKA